MRTEFSRPLAACAFGLLLLAPGYADPKFMTLPFSSRRTVGQGWRYWFDSQDQGPHNGVDIPAPAGTPVLAAADGVAMYALFLTDANDNVLSDPNGQTPAYGYGIFVRIRHGSSANNLQTLYGHLLSVASGIPRFAKNASNYSEWVPVTRGQVIGYVGSTGNSTGNHLHLGLESSYATNKVDPYNLESQKYYWFYPDNGSSYTSMGANHYWLTTAAGTPALASEVTVAPQIIFENVPPSGRWYKENVGLYWRVTQGSGPNTVTGWGPPGQINGPFTSSTGAVDIDRAGRVYGDFFARVTNSVGTAYTSHWIGGFDNLAPTLSLTGGAAPGVWLRGSQTASLLVADGDAGFRESAYGFGSVDEGTVSTINPRTINLPSTTGQYALWVRGEDSASTVAQQFEGNSITQSLGTFKIDNTNPASTITSLSPPSGGSVNGVAISVSGSDAHSGLNRIEVRVNGTLIGTVSGPTGSVNWNSSSFPTTCSIEVKAIDNVGNEFVTTSPYENDSTPPPAPTVVDEGSFTSSWRNLNFGLTMSDPESGTTDYEFKLGTTPGGNELRPTVAVTGNPTYQSLGNLNLPLGQPVYFSVRCRNGVGLWSAWGQSDGIVYDPLQFAALNDTNVVASGVEADGVDLHLSGTLAEGFVLGSFSGFWAFTEVATLTGNITLQDFIGNRTLEPIRLEFRQGGTTMDTQYTNLDSSGNYSLASSLTGTYDVVGFGPHWLGKNLGSVTLAPSGSATASGSLINGDCNGDNVVDLSDYILLVEAFNAGPLDGNWDARADVNGDEVIDLTDYTVVVTNFNLIGD